MSGQRGDGPTFCAVSWANAVFIAVVLVAVLVMPPLCNRRTWQRWGQKRAQRRLEATNRRLALRARQADFDALHRHYRTQRRLILAGHHPDLAGPVHLPSEGPFVPEQWDARQALRIVSPSGIQMPSTSTTGVQPSGPGSTQQTP